MVLGSCTKKGDAADVDLLHCVCEGAVWLGDGRREGVKVADDDGDGRDALGRKILFIGGNVPRKDTYGLTLVRWQGMRSS